MHHGQTRGKRKTQRIKRHVNFTKSGGKFGKVEGNNNFREIGEKSKNGHQKFWRMKIETFFLKT